MIEDCLQKYQKSSRKNDESEKTYVDCRLLCPKNLCMNILSIGSCTLYAKISKRI